jgi:protoporphyrinogen/coproporphyrinogen III oxidase
MSWDNMSKNEDLKRVAVIGGGLAGLSAAHRLIELARERNESIEVTLFEASSRLGGLIGTETIGGYLVDTGADSFLTNKPAAVSLCRRLGIENRLVSTDARYRGALVLREGRPLPIPEGFQLLSPTAILPVITSPLFSVWGKFRLLAEWFVPRRHNSGQNFTHGPRVMSGSNKATLIDESLSDFVLRRFGREALDRLIQPLVGGIYTADPERLSLAATMPRFLEMERDHGSLIRASLDKKNGKQRSETTSESTNKLEPSDSSSGARYGLFAGLKGGMADLVSALAAKVESDCLVRLNCGVDSINACASVEKYSMDGGRQRFLLTLSNGTEEAFHAVVVAASAARMADILEPLDSRLCVELRKFEYASSAIVVSGHRLSDIRDPLNAFGLVIPHSERRRIIAVSFSSRKFPDRAPADHVLLRTFVGGAMQPELFDMTDDQLIQIVREELADVLGVQGVPDFMRVVRYPCAMPQYHVGHLEHVARLQELMNQHTGITLAGIACHGVGIPDAIASGERAAVDIVCGRSSVPQPVCNT